MTSQVSYPPVTDDVLTEAVRRMTAVGNPQRIILFGSWARRAGRADSDLDLLVVEESDLPRYRRAARYLQALIGLFPDIDLVVWTPEEIEAWAQVPTAFITTAIREGSTLYAR